jgi:hypothetical protein
MYRSLVTVLIVPCHATINSPICVNTIVTRGDKTGVAFLAVSTHTDTSDKL